MTIRGSCSCNNFQLTWHVTDLSLVPRVCQCDYCAAKQAAYVSKSGSRFEVLIHDEDLHATVQHGSDQAIFHECSNCDEVLCVTALVGGELYGVLNANHLVNRLGFATPVKMDFAGKSAQEKRDRWRQNWCHPVRIGTN